MKKIIIGIIIVGIVVGLVYFARNKNTKDTIKMISDTAIEISAEKPKSSATTPTTLPTTHAAAIQGFAFGQRATNIKKGDTVIWTNKDSTPHTVTGNAGGPASPTLNANETYSFTFSTVGTFDYRCTFHPSMTGTIVVTQ